MTTGWGYYLQGSDQMQEIDELGNKLSVQINCGVHYPAFGKHLYECMCGVIFPVYLLKGGNWELVRKRHDEEKEYALS